MTMTKTPTPTRPIVGLDLSLTGTGIATGTPGELELDTQVVTTPPGNLIDRAAAIVARIEAQLPPDAYVVVEDLPPARANALKPLGILRGVVEWHLARVWRLEYVTLPPSTLKKLATGRGNAKKVEVLIAARERLGLDTIDDNAADAAWLHTAGAHLLGLDAAPPLPKAHLTALDKFR